MKPKCVPCNEGTFQQNNGSHATSCKPCKTCKRSEVVKVPCTKEHDTVCVCEPGTKIDINVRMCIEEPKTRKDFLKSTSTIPPIVTSTDGPSHQNISEAESVAKKTVTSKEPVTIDLKQSSNHQLIGELYILFFYYFTI